MRLRFHPEFTGDKWYKRKKYPIIAPKLHNKVFRLYYILLCTCIIYLCKMFNFLNKSPIAAAQRR